jgi:hypothetical protein
MLTTATATIQKQGIMDKVRDMRNSLSDCIPQQCKDDAHDHLACGKQFLSKAYFSEER